MSMKNSNDNVGNRTRDVPAGSAVPQPTASMRDPLLPVRAGSTLLVNMLCPGLESVASRAKSIVDRRVRALADSCLCTDRVQRDCASNALVDDVVIR